MPLMTYMEYKIYRVFSPDNLSYIGSTSQPVKLRISQHKYQAKTRRWGIRQLYQKGKFKFEDLRFEVLETTNKPDRFKRENFWISKFDCINRCVASQGPVGFKQTKFHIERSRMFMKESWKHSRDKMLKAVNKHKTKSFQRMASAIAHKKRYERLPSMEVRLSSGKKIGEYKTQNELAKLLGVCVSTAGRYLNGKVKPGHYKFRRIS